MLQHIRTKVKVEEGGGISITYTDGTAPYIISSEQGLPYFSATIDEGSGGLLQPNVVVSVCHQIKNIWSYTYNVRELGNNKAQHYGVVNIGTNYTFSLHQSEGTGDLYDYQLLRQSRIATDAEAYTLTTLSSSDISSLTNSHLFHTGAGSKYLYDAETSTGTRVLGPYYYISGAVLNINSTEVHGNSTNISLHTDPHFSNGVGASPANPLPAAPKGGDSGSPTLIYNSQTGQYEYIAAFHSANTDANASYAQARGNIEWTKATLAKFDAAIDMSKVSEIHLGAIVNQGETISDSDYTTTLYSGTATDTADNVLGEYIGLQDSRKTWKSLSGLKNESNWYAYNHDSYQETSDQDLFFTQNLVFTPSQKENKVILDATVDTGAGYTEFRKGTLDSASFSLQSATTGNYQLHTSGYVIHQGVDVHLQIVNPENYMTEWRKVGEGDLYIDGNGSTNALLNVGGSGKTYLRQTNGYAAYNVLANTGATVIIKNTAQIERDFTFGAGGGKLDMNGNSMDWYTASDGANRFTINALTEEAIICNSSDSSVLTYKQSGNTTWLGSFQDSENGSLNIDYQGGGTLTLHSIRTNLTNNTASGFTISEGKVILVGTNTVHAMGSESGRNTNRYTNADDWHYADASMQVTVKQNAAFELGSHARLTGDVCVENGGTYIMREGVTHDREYVEGGQILEDTAKYRDFYGHKGNTVLAENASLNVQFSAATTADTIYSGNITGKGNVNVHTAEAALVLEGTNTFSGTKTIQHGGLIAATHAALGDVSTHKWLVQQNGWIAIQDAAGVSSLTEDYIDTASNGALALLQDTATQVDLSSHANLFLGAAAGKIQYGAVGTNETLQAYNNHWKLGGGNGDLIVNYKLSGNNNLLIQNGTVSLANADNDFTGTISVTNGTLNINSLGNAVHLDNGQVNISDTLSGVFTCGQISGNGSLQLRFSNDIIHNTLVLSDNCTAQIQLLAGEVTYQDTIISNKLKLENGVKFKLGADSARIDGGLEIGSGSAQLLGTGDYVVNGSITGSGTLVNATGGTLSLSGSGNIEADLRLESGNTQLYSQNNSARLRSDIQIANGATMKFASDDTSDTLDYTSQHSITVEGLNSTLDFGKTRQTMGKWTLTLKDGATVTGEGGKYSGETRAALDYYVDGTILVTSGQNTINAVTRVRNSYDDTNTVLAYNIAKDAELIISKDIQGNGAISKTGEGRLRLTANNYTYSGSTTIEAGTLKAGSHRI